MRQLQTLSTSACPMLVILSIFIKHQQKSVSLLNFSNVMAMSVSILWFYMNFVCKISCISSRQGGPDPKKYNGLKQRNFVRIHICNNWTIFEFISPLRFVHQTFYKPLNRRRRCWSKSSSDPTKLGPRFHQRVLWHWEKMENWIPTKKY